jgi:hypothetical protein
MLSAGPMAKPCSETDVDFLLLLMRMPSLEILSHQRHAILMQLQCQAEIPSNPILSRRLIVHDRDCTAIRLVPVPSNGRGSFVTSSAARINWLNGVRQSG